MAASFHCGDNSGECDVSNSVSGGLTGSGGSGITEGAGPRASISTCLQSNSNKI
jgi:hypothetical protein